MKSFKLLFIFLITLVVFGNVRSVSKPLLNKIIYLDAGHGGIDPGAIKGNIYEKDINLSIVLKLRDKLISNGATVYLTRDEDVDLSTSKSVRKRSDLLNRAYLINKSNADIYLSIHLNSSQNSNYNGAQSFYSDINKDNKEISSIFQKYFNSMLNSNRESKKLTDLLMYNSIYKKGVLLEVGFISNDYERNRLLTDEYQLQIVDTIYSGIIEIFNL